MKQYEIKLNEEQARVNARALEFYSRFLAGQWRIPDAMEFSEYEKQGKSSDFWNKRNKVEDTLNQLKSDLTGLPLHASYGISSHDLHEDAKVAYDLYRPILEEFNKNSKHWNVYSSPGLSYSKQGRIEIKEVKDE